uniref:Chemokine interleukin-8-like domain-containing protein n=1 Tax=Neogobius melanostomus TaxID=47308 RepID=A0A8C6UT49_9GOBI
EVTSPRCKCVKTDSQVSLNLISTWAPIEPRPYCNKVEVIVTLKDGREVCITPNGEFHRFLEKVRK